MFVSTRDQGAVRRSRLYGINKSARSSKLSVLSSSSAVSTSSTGSTATITQDSYSRSRDHNGRSRRKRRTRDEGADGEEHEKGALKKSSSKEKKRSVDVFDFLVDETSRRAAAAVAEAESNQSSIPVREDILIESDPECYYRSHLSDSGISMGSSAGDAAIPDSPNTAPLPTLLEDASEHLYSSASSVIDCACCQQESQLNWNQYPGACYHGDLIPPGSASSATFFAPPSSFPHPDSEQNNVNGQSPTNVTSSPIIFRDKVGSRSTPRLFRRFKKINSRVLLQMQARIAELEHEIKIIDAREASNHASAESDATKSNNSKLRRSSKDEQTRRARIYHELCSSLDQYYQALIATHQVELITKPPSVTETQSFQKWIKSHIFNKGKTSELISDEADLVCFKPPAVRESPLSTFKIIALTAFINVLIPLVFYKFMTGILNRLIIWSVVVASGAMTMDKFGMKAERNYTTCIVAFGSISLGAALSL